jgi:hypothetical protein
MREVPKPIVKDERNNPKTGRHSGFISMLLAKMFADKMEDGKKMFRGSNINSLNPIHIPRRGKLKGWQKENHYRLNHR